MSHESPQTTLKLLQNLKISSFHKLIILSIHLPCLHNLIIILAFIWSQFQTLTMLMRTSEKCLFERESPMISLHFIEKYLFSKNLFDSINFPELTLTMLILAFIYLIIITVILISLLYAINRRLALPNIVLKMWKFFVDIHTLVFLYPLHLNTTQLIRNFTQENSSINQSLFNIIAVFSFIVLIYNLILALTLTVLFNANLKTKHPFSSKSNTVNLLDLFMKALLSFFIQKDSLPKTEKVVFMVMISTYCLFRDQNLMRILPYYRIKALKIATITHAITTSCIFAVLFAKIFCEAQNWIQYSVTLLFWVIFAPIFIKIYTSVIDNKLLRIIQHPFDIRSANLLTHYWEISKHYSKFGSTGVAASRFEPEYLAFVTIMNDLTQGPAWTLDSQNTKRQLFFERKIELLQNFIKKYPRDSWLAELALAKLYTKKESSCVLAYHIIHKYMDRSLLDKTSLMLIQLKILNKLQCRFDYSQASTKSQKESLQISNFVRLLDQYKKMKRDIVQNIDYHLKFWKIFAAPKPNFLKMIQLAQQNLTSSKKLKSISKQCKDFKKFFFSEPLLSVSLYYYFFQDETLLAANLLKEYFETEQHIKHTNEKAKNQAQQNPTAGFSPDAVYLIVSCEQNQPGQILDCSGRISSVFGYPKDSLIGKSINVFIPPIYAKSHDYFLKTSQKISSKNILNSTRPVSILVQEGYVQPGLIHVSLAYMQDYDLCYYVLLETIKDDTRLVLLNSSGAITSCSENFAIDLGFNQFKDQDFLNIRDLCPNFFEKIQKGKSSQQTSLAETLTPLHNDGFIQEIFTKEIPKLYFFPFWHNSPQQQDNHNLIQKDPIIYQVKLRKLKTHLSEIYELKMHKVSTFSFTPPASLRRTTFQLSIKDLPLQSTSAKMSLDLQQPKTDSDTKSSDKTVEFGTRRNRLDTPPPQEAIFTARTTHRLLSMRSPRGKRNSDFLSATTTLGMITELPILPASENDQEGESYTNTEDDHITASLSKEQKESSSHNKEKNHQEFLQELIRNSSTTETGIGKLGSTKSVERQKIVKRLVQARTHRSETKLFISFFAVICLLLLALLIWLNFYTSNTSKNVTTYSDVLQNAYFRSYWTKIANQDTLYWLGAVTKWVDYDLDILTSGFNKSFHRMNHYNQALENSISFISEELQEMHYHKKVKVYDRDPHNEKVLIAIDDTFQATKRIMNRGLVNFQRATSGYDFEEKINQDSYFIFDNSLNDLQIQEAFLITAIKDRLFDIFDDSHHTILAYMGTTFFFVFLFMAFSLKYTITTNINFKHFITILYMLKKSDVKRVEHVSSVFKELLEKDDHEKDLLFSLYDSEKFHTKEIQTDNTVKRDRQQNRENYFNPNLKGPLKKVYSRNILFFLGLFVFTGLTVGFSLVYYTRSSNKLDIMQKQQININSALNFVNSLSWITTEVQLITLFNFTLPTRNIPVVDRILDDIEQFKNINVLQNSLQNEKGEFSPEMKVILFNFSCDNAYSPYYSYPLSLIKSECKNISNGENKVGLLEITSRLGMILSADIPELYKGPKDLDTLQKFYNGIYDVYSFLIDVEFVLLLSAYVVAIDEFKGLVDDLERLQTQLAWLAATFSFSLGVFTWIFIMRRILKLDFESRELLSFVPTRLLLRNPQLKRYLVSTAKSNDTFAKSLLR